MMKNKIPHNFENEFPNSFLRNYFKWFFNKSEAKGENSQINISPEIEVVHRVNLNNDRVTEFWFKPNVKIIINKIEIHTGNFLDQINYNEIEIAHKNTWKLFVAYDNVEANQKWKFKFYVTEPESNILLEKEVGYKV